MSRISHGSLLASLLVSSALIAATPPAFAKKYSFDMPVSAGAATCLPNATAHVTITPHGATDEMHVRAKGLPPNTDFDLFVIQVPTAPFGFSWYQGDVETDDNGVGNGDFVGRFSVESTVIDPNTAAAPVVFPTDAASNPAPLDLATPSIQTYHLGLWFNRTKDAAKAGCADTQTPFDGEHNAGIQVLNTANFPADSGPLRNVK
jgi:hypothetical protein